MVFASDLWAFILANSRATLDARPRGKIDKEEMYQTGIAAITYFATRISAKKRNHQIITWRNAGQSKDKTENKKDDQRKE